MPLKGIDKFRAKIPKLSGRKIVILPLYAFSMLIISLIIELYFDILPSLLALSVEWSFMISFLPILGVLLMGILGLFLTYQMWARRDRLKAKYKQLSYQKVFLSGFGGVAIILGIALHNFLSFLIWQNPYYSQVPYSVLTTPLTCYLPYGDSLFFYARIILSVIFAIIGLLMVYRALAVFGFDYMVVLYLYFPEESELQDNAIYSVLRHPTYAAAIIICLGGMIFQLNVYSIICFIMYLIGFYYHIHFIEEAELIQRFGDSYKDYRKKVPAFFVRPGKLGTFFRFLFKKA